VPPNANRGREVAKRPVFTFPKYCFGSKHEIGYPIQPNCHSTEPVKIEAIAYV